MSKSQPIILNSSVNVKKLSTKKRRPLGEVGDMYTHTYINTYIHIYIHTYIYIYTHIYLYKRIHTTQTHIYMYTHTIYACKYICHT